MIGLLSVLAPGLLGSLIGQRLALLLGLGNELKILLVGAGGVLGFIFMGLVISLSDKLGVSILSPTTVKVLGIAAIVTLFFASLVVSAWLSETIRYSYQLISKVQQISAYRAMLFVVTVGLAVLVAGVLAIGMYVAITSPVQGWDTLGLWGENARYFIAYDSQDWTLNDFRRSNGDPWPLTDGRHPMTVVFIAAFSGYALSFNLQSAGALIPWVYAWLCGGLIVFGLMKLVMERTILSIFPLYLYFTFPLFGNHVISPGYADFWVSEAVLAAAALLAAGYFCEDRRILCLGYIFALIPLLLKNTGILYSASLLTFPILLQLRAFRHRSDVMKQQSGKSSAITSLLLLIALFLLLYLYLMSSGAETIRFGGYIMDIEVYRLASITQNTGWAFLINQSFSTFFFISLTALSIFLPTALKSRCPVDTSLIFLTATSASMLLLFMAPQLIEHYSSTYATPGSDVGNSRFLMPFGLIAILIIGLMERTLAEMRAIDK